MSERKTRKLTCIVTGRQLIATREYYERKVLKAGSEDTLHDTYICREAKNLIRKGTSIDKAREVLNVNVEGLGEIPQEIITEIQRGNTKTNFRRINNITNISNMMNSTTDPDVKEYINTLITSEK